MDDLKVTFRQYFLVIRNPVSLQDITVFEEEYLNGKRKRKRTLGKTSNWRATYLRKIIEDLKTPTESSDKNIVFKISEETAFRTALAIRALSWVKQREPAEFLMNVVSSMQREEVYFWYAKMIENGKRRTSKALRALYAPRIGDGRAR